MSQGRSLVAPIIMFVLGGLWILLTGGCTAAIFQTMPGDQRFAVELILTLPGCVLVLVGAALLAPRLIAGLMVAVYAAVLAGAWNSQVIDLNQNHPKGEVILLIFINIPVLALAIWAAVLLLGGKASGADLVPPNRHE